MATQVPACMHALLAGAEIPAQSADIQEMTQYHYAKAVIGLRESLEKQGSAKGWLVTMHTVLMLCIYEVSPRQVLICKRSTYLLASRDLNLVAL